MYKKIFLMIVVCGIGFTGCTSNETKVDTSEKVKVDTSVKDKELNDSAKSSDDDKEKEKKIVAATLSATQLMDKLDVNLVGVPYTQYKLPAKYEELPTVGQAMSTDLEVVKSLDTDLIIMDKSFKEKVEGSLKEYGIEAYFIDTSSYEGFIKSIEELGALVDSEDEADKLIQQMRDAQKLADEMKKDNQLEVAVLFGGGKSFMLATDKSYIGDLVDIVGVDNVTDDQKIESAYIPLSTEELVVKNPDYILRFSHANLEETKKAFDEAFAEGTGLAELDAVKNGKIIDLDPDIFGVSANIHAIEAIKQLTQVFYGE